MFRINAKRLRFLVALLLAASLFIIPVSAKFTTISVYIRGQELICDPMVRRIDDLTYVPLRAFVQALDEEAQFSWSDETQCAVVSASGVEIKIRQDGSYIVANGRYLYLDGGNVRNEEGSLMLPIRPLAKAFGVTVEEEKSFAYAPIHNDKTLEQHMRIAFEHLGETVIPRYRDHGIGSTDMGNVSQALPAIHGHLLLAKQNTHTDAFREAAGGPEGDGYVIRATKAMVLTAIGLATDPDVLHRHHLA